MTLVGDGGVTGRGGGVMLVFVTCPGLDARTGEHSAFAELVRKVVVLCLFVFVWNLMLSWICWFPAIVETSCLDSIVVLDVEKYFEWRHLARTLVYLFHSMFLTHG